MILAVDAQYSGDKSYVAGVLFESWAASEPSREYITTSQVVNDYVPGEFYKRELPGILKLLNEHSIEPDTIIIDGFVYLDGSSRPGLGKHLYDALSAKTKIIGVAKNRFKNISKECAVFRGQSKKPIYVTAAGLELETAKQQVQMMHGAYRIPSLLKRVDQLCRERAKEVDEGLS